MNEFENYLSSAILCKRIILKTNVDFEKGNQQLTLTQPIKNNNTSMKGGYVCL